MDQEYKFSNVDFDLSDYNEQNFEHGCITNVTNTGTF